MITEITEAPYYVQTDTRLAAPLLNEPFTHGEIGVLMQKGQEDLMEMVNNAIGTCTTITLNFVCHICHSICHRATRLLTTDSTPYGRFADFSAKAVCSILTLTPLQRTPRGGFSFSMVTLTFWTEGHSERTEDAILDATCSRRFEGTAISRRTMLTKRE